MNYKILKGNEVINKIVADHDFVETYCKENGYTYELLLQPEPESEETGPSQDEDLMAMAIDHEYRLTLLELGASEI